MIEKRMGNPEENAVPESEVPLDSPQVDHHAIANTEGGAFLGDDLSEYGYVSRE